MEEIKELKKTLEELTDDMLSRIQLINEYNESDLILTLDKINVFNTLINDLSLYYECALIINQYQNLNNAIQKINNILDYVYVNYDHNLFLTFEIITMDFKTILFEMKGALQQCIH